MAGRDVLEASNDFGANAMGLFPTLSEEEELSPHSAAVVPEAPAEWYSSSARSPPPAVLAERRRSSSAAASRAGGSESPRASVPRVRTWSRRRDSPAVSSFKPLKGSKSVSASLPSAKEPLSPKAGGRIGRYSVVRCLANGGEGSIFLVSATLGDGARELALKRRVFTGFVEGNDGLREAVCMSRVSTSPFCVKLEEIFQVGQDDDGGFALCFVMEYCGGGDLFGKLLHSMGAQEAPFNPRTVKAMLVDLLRGLDAIHSAGITHRDLKLENVLLGDDGRLKITDFGLAVPAVAGLQGFVGSFQYAPPELEENKDAVYSYVVDVWALGVMAFELAAGYVWASKHKFESLGVIAARQSEFDVVPWLNELSKEMREEVGPLVTLMLRKDPGRRPSCKELLRETAVD